MSAIELAADLRRMCESDEIRTVLHVIGSEELGRGSVLARIACESGAHYFSADYVAARFNRSDLRHVLSSCRSSGTGRKDLGTLVIDRWQLLAENTTRSVQFVRELISSLQEIRLIVLGSDQEPPQSPVGAVRTRTIHLRPLRFREVGKAWTSATDRDRATAHGVFGTSYRVLHHLNTEGSIREHLLEQMLSPAGGVRMLLEGGLDRFPGRPRLRKLKDYRSLLRTIGYGRRSADQLRSVVAGSHFQNVREKLARLIERDLVVRTRRFGSGRGAHHFYRIRDPAWRFFYSFVHPHRSSLATRSPESVWNQFDRREWHRFMTASLQELLREALRDTSLGLAETDGCTDWSFWDGAGRGNRHRSIPLIGERSDGGLVTANAKWSDRPLDLGHVRNHLGTIWQLAYQGHRWAQRALDPSSAVIFLTASGWEGRVLEKAPEMRPRVRLIDLRDLYHGDASGPSESETGV